MIEEVMVSSREGEIDDRKKLRLSKEQAAVLEEAFKEQKTVNPVSHIPRKVFLVIS